jgi:hypothetical protein
LSGLPEPSVASPFIICGRLYNILSILEFFCLFRRKKCVRRYMCTAPTRGVCVDHCMGIF